MRNFSDRNPDLPGKLENFVCHQFLLEKFAAYLNCKQSNNNAEFSIQYSLHSTRFCVSVIASTILYVIHTKSLKQIQSGLEIFIVMGNKL